MLAVFSAFDDGGLRKKLLKLKAGLEEEAVDDVVEEAGLQALAEIIARTPKKWFGQVRRGWQIERPRAGKRIVANENKIMGWLEDGTKAHGPVRADRLFIPLTRKAALAYAARRRTGLVYGVDYVLVKWVRGIRARKIVEGFEPRAQEILLQAMEAYVRKLIDG